MNLEVYDVSNDDNDDEEETLGEYIQSTKQLKKIRRQVEVPRKEGSHGYDN